MRLVSDFFVCVRERYLFLLEIGNYNSFKGYSWSRRSHACFSWINKFNERNERKHNAEAVFAVRQCDVAGDGKF